MDLITPDQRRQLEANGKARAGSARHDPFPVVKLFLPDAAATWLLTEIDAAASDVAFGLCDPGLGSPELGLVSLSELAVLRGRLGRRVERDLAFVADRPLSHYAAAARRAGTIVT